MYNFRSKKKKKEEMTLLMRYMTASSSTKNSNFLFMNCRYGANARHLNILGIYTTTFTSLCYLIKQQGPIFLTNCF